MSARPGRVPVDGRRVVDVAEELTTSAPLGVRFWDWALDRPVRDGLVVTAHPHGGGPSTTARPSSSGVYGFLSLPTTGAAERGPVAAFTDTPDAYVLQVSDASGRYVPMTLVVSAPVAGVQPAPGTLPEVDGESPALPGFPVFAAATRTVPPGHLGVRAELRDADRPVPGSADVFAAASHALVAVTVGGATWYGVSDAGGRVLVIVPAPTMAGPANGDGPLDLADRSWEVEVEIHYERLTGAGVPAFADIADQPTATARFADAAWTESHTFEKTYGDDLVVRSPQRSDLLVKAPAQP